MTGVQTCALPICEANKIAGSVGALVVIFDDDRDDRYTYLATWQGEHQNESDMAFYATDPTAHVVGPGIGRAEYGGFLMTLPPRRMAYVWSDPDYAFAESKRLYMERLKAGRIEKPTEVDKVHARVMEITGDPLPYGIEPNRKTIETLIGHALKQGIITKPVTVEELFAPETLGLIG